jgi:hypothetical protein
MADRQEQESQAGASEPLATGSDGEGGGTGDPGRTPSKAEGDEQTVDDSLGNEKGNG